MSKGRITKEQLSDSLLNFITQNAGSAGSGGVASLEFKKNSTVIESSTNRVAIGISGFNKSKDLLMVYKNSVYLEEDVIYTITSDNLYIQKIEGNWNESGSSVFNFVVIKGGATASVSTLSADLNNKSDSKPVDTDGYSIGNIIYNSNPKPGNFVGWILCDTDDGIKWCEFGPIV